MKLISLTALLTILLPLLPLLGLSHVPTPPRAHAVTSPNGRFIFVIEPGKALSFPHLAYGRCLEVEDDGTFQENWTTIGWFSSRILLASNGNHLVRIHDEAEKPEDLGLTFYDRNEVIVQHQISNLTQPADREVSDSGLSWIDWNHPPTIKEGTLHLRTRSGTALHFQLSTGERRPNQQPSR